MSQITARINGGPALSRYGIAPVDAIVTLDSTSRAGWSVPATRWFIRCSKSGFTAPAGWTFDADKRIWTTTTNTTPPAVTLTHRAAYLFWFEPRGKEAPEGSIPVLVDVANTNGTRDVVLGESTQSDAANGYLSKFNDGLGEGLVGPGSGGGASGANLGEPVAWTAFVPFDESSHAVLDTGSNLAVTVSVDGSRPINAGSEATRLLKAGVAASLRVPRSWGKFTDPVNQGVPDDWDPLGDGDYMFGATACDDGGSWIGFGRACAPQVTTAPTIVSRTIASDQLGRLVVVYSVPMWFHDATGVAVTSPSRTITGIYSGDGTATHTYTLSSPVGWGDTPSLTISSGRTIHNQEGILAPTGTASITIGGGVADPTDTFSTRVLDLRGDVGNPASDGGGVSPWTSQDPSSRPWTATNAPLRDNDGIHGDLVSVNYDGVNDVSTHAGTTISLVTGGNAGWYVAGILQVVSASAVGSGYAVAHGICADPSGYLGLYFYTPGGSSARITGYQYDSTARVVESADFAIGSPVYFALRQDGTNGMRLYLNGNAPVSVAGATAAVASGGMSEPMRIGQNSGSVFGNFRLHRLLWVPDALSDSDHNALMTYYANKLA